MIIWRVRPKYVSLQRGTGGPRYISRHFARNNLDDKVMCLCRKNLLEKATRGGEMLQEVSYSLMFNGYSYQKGPSCSTK